MKNKIIIYIVVTVAISALIALTELQVPESSEVIDFQFNMFTISSVLAGFSFTTLGILLGMSSEELIKKIKNTTIITQKSERIAMSLVFFCLSGFVSLLFVTGILTLLGGAIYRSFYFISIISLLVGIVYFVISVYEIYDLITKVYGLNTQKAKDKKDQFQKDLEAAKERQEEILEGEQVEAQEWKHD